MEKNRDWTPLMWKKHKVGNLTGKKKLSETDTKVPKGGTKQKQLRQGNPGTTEDRKNRNPKFPNYLHI